MIWNTIMSMEENTDPFDPEKIKGYTFEDIYQSMPQAFKIKEDPRPVTNRMYDWTFKEKVCDVNNSTTYIPRKVVTSQYATFPPQNQLIGSCGGEAGSNLMERLENQTHGLTFPAAQSSLSGQYLYWWAEQLDNHPGEGTYGWAVCEALRKYGVCRMEKYQQSRTYKEFLKWIPSLDACADAKTRLIHSYYSITDVREIAIALQKGMGIWMSLECHTGWNRPVITLPQPGDRWLGGHAIEPEDIDLDKEEINFQNSWGLTVGDGSGHQRVSFEYWKRYGIECRAIRWK